MKHRMTNAQIDEVNELLTDHGDAITAFVDEMVDEVKSSTRTTIGIIVPIVIIASGLIGAAICEVIQKKKKNNTQEDET